MGKNKEISGTIEVTSDEKLEYTREILEKEAYEDYSEYTKIKNKSIKEGNAGDSTQYQCFLLGRGIGKLIGSGVTLRDFTKYKKDKLNEQ